MSSRWDDRTVDKPEAQSMLEANDDDESFQDVMQYFQWEIHETYPSHHCMGLENLVIWTWYTGLEPFQAFTTVRPA